MGRGAYGVVEKMRHKQTGTILAVKVKEEKCIFGAVSSSPHPF